MTQSASKIRVYDLSKQLGISNKNLILLLEKDYGLVLKSHSSTVEADIVTKLLAGQTQAAGEPVQAAPKQANVPLAHQSSTEASEAPPVVVAEPEAPKPAIAATEAPALTTTGMPTPPPTSQRPTPDVVNSVKAQAPSPITGLGGVSSQPQPATRLENKPQGAEQSHQAVGYGANQPLNRAATGQTATNQPLQPNRPDGYRRGDQPLNRTATGQTVANQPLQPNRPGGYGGGNQPLNRTATGQTATNQPQQQSLPPNASQSGIAAATITTPRSASNQAPTRDDNYSRGSRQPATITPAELGPVALPDALTVAELAARLQLKETEIIKHLFMKGVMVTLNQNLEPVYARTIATELGYEVETPDQKTDPRLAQLASVLNKKSSLDTSQYQHLESRAPVVSIMGHVDHGKTSLLDAIRETRHRIVDAEAGGITQRIGAYTVEKEDHRIVFLDTPGHEAFTTMRMRGAKSTDIAILVVAADDGVMPQTIEAINHAKAAEIPIIVAINKIDKDGADPDRVLVGLSDQGLVAEKWGGDTITVEVSALQKLGLDDLLEMVLLVSELLELKADPTVPAAGVIIEARLDKRKGPVVAALVQNGTLRIGDNILIGPVGGRVRALLSDTGERIQEAGPSTPVEILGLSDVPRAGDPFEVLRDDRQFRQQMNVRKLADREQRLSVNQPRSLGLTGHQSEGPVFINMVIKADTQGSLEAVTGSLMQLDQEQVQLKILHAGTGDVSEADVSLASASRGLIVAFNVKEDPSAQKIAESVGLTVLTFDVIYHLTEAIEQRMKGQLAPEVHEVETGQAEVRQVFTVGKTQVIAGCMVTKGKIIRNGKAVVQRGRQDIFTGVLDNLKRFKDDAKEVAAGYECGISFSKFNDLQVGDIITLFTEEVIQP